MAIYRAVGQNTYKFVTETNFTLSQDLTVPNRAFGFPMVKFYSSTMEGYRYMILTPYSNTNYYSPSNNSVYVTSGSASSLSGGGVTHVYPVTIDGETYYGYKNAYYQGFILNEVYNSTYWIQFKKCTLKVVKYVASSSTIVTEEYVNISVSTAAFGTSSQYYYVRFQIPKQSDDIILAIETTFPEE